MSERLYYADPYCRAFDATVTALIDHGGRPAVLLDRTAFYPTSGGQPFDVGRLGDVQVIETLERGDDVAHVLAAPIQVGTRVAGTIDWSRRFDHMQQHTGQHVLSAAFDRLLDNRTMSFHMGSDVSTIDVQREVASADVERAVDEANRIVWEDRPVTIRFATAQEAATLPLRKESVRQGTLRLIEVEGFDLSACGGTHVARTGAVGAIAVIGSERLRGGTRLAFVCGGRAVKTLRGYRDAVAGAARVLSVLPGELPAAVERLHGESKELRKRLKFMQDALTTHEAVRLLAISPEHEGVHRGVHVLDGWDAEGLKAIAVAMAGAARAAVVLLSRTTPAFVVVARSQGVSIDANAVLRALIARFGGRGGGRPDLAQGGGLGGDPAAIAAAAQAALG